jgi:RNA polymerase sigma-70 factor (ECF subfamily)
MSGPRWDDIDVLVGAAVRGEPQAMDSLLRSINPLVVRYCRARLGPQERTFASANDVAQEVCLAVLKALPHYRDQGRPFQAFVYGIAAHKVADAHRAAARDKADPVPYIPEEPVQAGGPEQLVLQAELAGQMDRLLDTLPDKQREILVLRIVLGLSTEETAEAIESTPGVVRVAQHRALARLRSVLPSQEMV